VRRTCLKEIMPPVLEVSSLFQSVLDTLIQKQPELNQADPYNQDHGDHMVEIFRVAVRAAQEKRSASLADAMQYASQLLGDCEQNGSAQIYARGLTCLADQFSQRQIDLDDLAPYAQVAISGKKQENGNSNGGRSGDILKALLTALAEWERLETEKPDSSRGMDLGYLFGVGMAYLQAKQQGGDRLRVLAETVVSASPLGRVPHRHQSGLLVVQQILHSLGNLPDAN
jgi:hypothetical protein